MNTPTPEHLVRVWDDTRWHRFRAPDGANLRRTLLAHGFSPYTRWTRRLNCGGRGLCATCGVRFDGPAPPPTGTTASLRALATRASPARSP